MAPSARSCEKLLQSELELEAQHRIEAIAGTGLPKRILSVTQSYYPFQDRGGPAFKVRSISRMLAELGNRVTVVTADLGFADTKIASAGVVRCAQGWRTDLDGVEVIYLTTRARYRNLTVNPGVLSFCRNRLREFDIVHIYGLYDALGPVVAKYCRRFGIPYFVEPLGMTRLIDRGLLLKRLWRRLVTGYLEDASRMVVTSELEKAELVEDGFPTTQLLLRYNGIDQKEFSNLPLRSTFREKFGIRDDEPLVVFLSRLIPRKGADLLIEAMSQTGCDRIRLVIAGPEGEAGYVAFLRDKARMLGVDHRVLFLGPLYGADKKAALMDADVFALPSRYENFGNTAAEALACGTPVIVSDRCGIAPLIDQRAGLVTSYDANALAGALRELFGSAALYHRLKAGCPEVASELSWGRIIGQMQASYDEATEHVSH
jgi:glycosyltransferase involved in cell wall biosynthesis